MAPRRRSSVAAAIASAAAMAEYDDFWPSIPRDVQKLSEKMHCKICDDTLTSPTSLPCGHSFCLACVESALAGPGVYESKCPQCGVPVHFKNIRVNQSYASLMEPIEAARSRFPAAFESLGGGRSSQDREESLKKSQEPTPSPPVDDRCCTLANDLVEIDGAIEVLQERLSALERNEQATAKNAKNAKNSQRQNSQLDNDPDTAPTPTPIYVSAPPHTQSTQSMQRTPHQPQHTQVKQLNLAQAKQLYRAAHGRQPPKKIATLKKLRENLSSLDKTVVAQLLEMVLGEGRGEEPGVEEQQAEQADPMDAAYGGGFSAHGAGDPPKTQRVFAHAFASTSASKNSKNELNEMVEKVNKVVPETEHASSVSPGDGFPENATHLLMNLDTKNRNPNVVRNRTVRYLEAVARGAWVLDFSYLAKCAEARTWLPEAEFELTDKGRDDKHGKIKPWGNVIVSETPIGPIGGRRRVETGGQKPFVGEVVAVASAPERLLVSEMVRILVAGGAEGVLTRPSVSRLGGRSTIGSIGSAFKHGNKRKSEVIIPDTNIPESVPDSQQSPSTLSQEYVNNWALGATVVVDGGDGGGVPVGQFAQVPVVDWHWVLHSLVYHTPLPKSEYPVETREGGGGLD